VFVLALTMTPARAAVRLHGLFASNMVLQQGVPVTVWGYGAEGEVVTLRFKQQLLTTVVTNGNWSVRLAPMPASAMPATLSVTGTVAPRRGTTSGIGTTNGVRIVNVKGKEKRMGKFAGRRSGWKKAYVCLKAGQDINFAEGENK